jgi:transposase
MLTKAVDDVRRAEVMERPELRRTRYAWLKRPENLTRRQRGQIEWLTARHLALRTARAYAWRLAFDEFFDQPADQAEGDLERWYRGAIRSRLAPIQAFAQTVRTRLGRRAALASDPHLQRRARGDQLARASSQATGSRIPHDGEPHRDDLPHRRQA